MGPFDRSAMTRKGGDFILGGLGIVGCAALFLMMVLTFVDVAARYVFNAPIMGSFDLTELMLVVVIFCGLPLVTARSEHVAIDLIDPVIPKDLRIVQRSAIDIVCGVATGFAAIRLWEKAEGMAVAGEANVTLGIQMSPFVYFMAVLMGATAVAFFVNIVRRKGDGGASSGTAL